MFVCKHIRKQKNAGRIKIAMTRCLILWKLFQSCACHSISTFSTLRTVSHGLNEHIIHCSIRENHCFENMPQCCFYAFVPFFFPFKCLNIAAFLSNRVLQIFSSRWQKAHKYSTKKAFGSKMQCILFSQQQQPNFLYFYKLPKTNFFFFF